MIVKIVCIYCLINSDFVVTIGRRLLVSSRSLKGKRNGCSEEDTADIADKYFSGMFSERHNQDNSLSQPDFTVFCFSTNLINQFDKTFNQGKTTCCV